MYKVTVPTLRTCFQKLKRVTNSDDWSITRREKWSKSGDELVNTYEVENSTLNIKSDNYGLNQVKVWMMAVSQVFECCEMDINTVCTLKKRKAADKERGTTNN